MMLFWNVFLAFAWGALNGTFDLPTIAVGFVLGYGVLWIVQRSDRRGRYFARVPLTLKLVLLFAKELLRANVRVAMEVITPRVKTRPGIVAVPLEAATDVEITLLANLITLTPGTVTLDIAPDRRFLYVHVMDVREGSNLIQRQIKDGFESRLLEVMRS